MKMKVVLFAVGLLAVCLTSAGCGGAGGSSSQSATPAIAAIEVSPSSFSLPIGLTQRLVANARYNDGSSKNISSSVTWHSSDTNLATVEANGEVKSLAIGPVTITATIGSLSGSASVTVSGAVITRLALDPLSPSIAANTTQQFTAMGFYSDDTARDVSHVVTWSSSAPSVAAIDNLGTATSILAGTTTLTASSGSVSASTDLTVTSAVLISIAVVPYQPVRGIGMSERLLALGSFDDHTVRELNSVTWSSSNPSVASVSNDVITTLAPGATTLMAVAGSISGNTVLTVLNAPLTSIALEAAPIMAAGTEIQLGSTGKFADGSTRELSVLTWSSSNAQTATVNDNGVVHAVAPGNVTITASSGVIAGIANITVTNANIAKLVVAPAIATVPMFATQQMFAIGEFSDGSVQDVSPMVTWVSRTPAVAHINKQGLANGLATGSTVLTAELGALRGSTTLNVNGRVNSVVVLPDIPTLPKGVRQRFQLVGALADGSQQPIVGAHWRSSNIQHVTIDSDGVAVARGTGNSSIYGQGCCKTGSTIMNVTSWPSSSISIGPDGDTIGIGAAKTFTAQGMFFDGTSDVPFNVTDAVHWSSSAPAVATIDPNGVATGLSTGDTTITAVFGPVSGSSTTRSYSVSLHVNAAMLNAITVNPGAASIALGETQQFTVTGSFSDGTVQPVANVVWNSSNPDVAVVHGNGLAVSSGKGTTVVTATSGSAQGSASLAVN